MKHTITLFLVLLTTKTTFAQTVNETINPKDNLYIGTEIGLNTITSFSQGEQNHSFQAGVLAEYYTGRHWSFSARIKYFETGVSFIKTIMTGACLRTPPPHPVTVFLKGPFWQYL